MRFYRQLFYFVIILFFACQVKPSSKIDIQLYQIYLEDRPQYGHDAVNYMQAFFIIINNFNDSIELEKIGNELKILPDSLVRRQKINEYILKKENINENFLNKNDTAFLVKWITFNNRFNMDLEYTNVQIESNMMHLKSNLINDNINYQIHPNLKYFCGEIKPYVSKLSKDPNYDYKENYRNFLYEYTKFYNRFWIQDFF